MERRRKRVTDLNQEIQSYIRVHKKEKTYKTSQLQSAWEKVATVEALKHTDNIVISKRKNEPALLIYVDNNHWAAQLEMQKELYQFLLEKELKRQIPGLYFLVSQKASYKKEFIKERTKEKLDKEKEVSVALTEEEDAHVREMVAEVKNEELKNRLYNAIKKDFEWKKGKEGLKLAENAPESPETI